MRSVKSMLPESVRSKYRCLRAQLLSVGLNGNAKHTMSPKERSASADISVIVPIHDAPEVTERCLRSLERNGGDAEVILIDDGSKMERTRVVINQVITHNGWLLDRNETPLGHSRACESGARIASRSLLCFLNSDTVVTPYSWAGMVSAIKMDHLVGIVGPSTSCTSTRQKIRRAELCRFYWTDNQIDEFAFRQTTRNQNAGLLDMDYVGGFAFMLSRSAWERSEGFDPQLSAYGNELDLCRRLKKRGYRSVWTRASYIHHLGESSFLQHFTPEELHRQRVVASRYVDAKTK